jgi:hypothetical protein
MLNRTTMLTYYLFCLEMLIKEQTPNQATSGLTQGLPDQTPDPILYSSSLILTSRCSHTVYTQYCMYQRFGQHVNKPRRKDYHRLYEVRRTLTVPLRFIKCPAIPLSIRKSTPYGGSRWLPCVAVAAYILSLQGPTALGNKLDMSLPGQPSPRPHRVSISKLGTWLLIKGWQDGRMAGWRDDKH